MNQYKGFSLFEVLVALTLTTTFALFLLHLQGLSKVYFNQSLMQIKASSLLDQTDEFLLLGGKLHSALDKPFILNVTRYKEKTIIDISWPGNSLSRLYSLPKGINE